jgi:hypothetical protein
MKAPKNKTRIRRLLVDSTVDAWQAILCGINGSLPDMNTELEPPIDADAAGEGRIASFAFASAVEGNAELVSNSSLVRINVAEGFRHNGSWRLAAWKN